ncbi:hypothetical protein [Scytonema sp. NUACC26]|uniref:hypothetical protein n=1 Tax=Scytonema sp. NUACC26 TaxID=3140176 RepID=UPI0038B23A3B
MRSGKTLIVLVAGGDKKSQSKEHNVNFGQSQFAKSVFKQIFGAVLCLAFSGFVLFYNLSEFYYA